MHQILKVILCTLMFAWQNYFIVYSQLAEKVHRLKNGVQIFDGHFGRENVYDLAVFDL